MAKRSPYLVKRPTKALNDEHLIRAVLETMWQSVDIHRGYDKLRAGLSVATPGQVAVFAVRWCDHEICNGGFHQLFYNSTGILFQEALQGLQQIGATDYASFFSQAASLLPSADVPRDRDERIRLLERVPYEQWKKQIKPIEDAYYALRRTGTTVERYAARYIEEHPEDFFEHRVRSVTAQGARVCRAPAVMSPFHPCPRLLRARGRPLTSPDPA